MEEYKKIKVNISVENINWINNQSISLQYFINKTIEDIKKEKKSVYNKYIVEYYKST